MRDIAFQRVDIAHMTKNNTRSIRAIEEMLSGIKDSDYRVNVVKVTSSQSVDDSQIILVDATSGAVTISLNEISKSIGKRYIIKKIDAAANAVTVLPNGTETIDGASSSVIISQYEVLRIVPFGTDWMKV